MATKLKKQLKEHEEESMKILKNYMKVVNKIDDIDKISVEKMFGYIDKAKNPKNKKDYSASWKKLKLYALASYYDMKEIKTKYEYILKKAHEYSKKIEAIEEKQEKTEKEKENELNIFELRNICEEYKNYKHKDDMYKYLILSSICKDQEPLRPQIYIDLKYVNVLKEVKDDDQNYIYISKGGKSGFYYINDDKVTGHIEKQIKKGETKKEMKRIKLKPEFLKIVKKSFVDYPREYLFDFNVENGEHKLLFMLQDITNNKFNFQMARSVYITHKYLENNNMSYVQKKALAKNMRHTKQTQEKAYLKHGVTVTDKKLSELKKEVEDSLKKTKDLEKKLNENIKTANKIKKNNKYENQDFKINVNTDEKQKMLLLIQEINAKHKKYEETNKEIEEIIKENGDKLKPLKKIINVKDYLMVGNYASDRHNQSELINELKKLGRYTTMKKIKGLKIKTDGYDEKDINKEIIEIINTDDIDDEDVEINDIDKMTKEELMEYKKKRKDIIYVANKRLKKSIENKDKKKKGTISATNMYKYKIVYNEKECKYE